MTFKYDKSTFKLLNDRGVAIRMAENSLKDGWYTFVYSGPNTEFAFYASVKNVDEVGRSKYRGQWLVKQLGSVTIGKVAERGFALEERRQYLAEISDALSVFPFLNPHSRKFETCDSVLYLDAQLFGQ